MYTDGHKVGLTDLSVYTCAALLTPYIIAPVEYKWT